MAGYTDLAQELAATLGSLRLAPSGDLTGATDAANINAALAANYRVLGVPGSTYFLGAPIQPISGSYLDMTNCILQNTAGFPPMLQNAAATTPAATATDVVATSGSAVITSPQLIAGGAAIGNVVYVVGASYAGAPLYGKIASIAGNNITLTYQGQGPNLGIFQAKTTIASGGTAFLWTTRDHDITILGGYWIEQANTSANSTWHLRRIDRLTVKDVIFANTGTYNGANHLTFHTGDIDQFLYENIHFDTVNQVLSDGVHLMGPISNGKVINVTGNTHDDFIAVATVDGFNPTKYDTSGNIYSVTIDGVYPENSLKAVHLYNDDASHIYSMTGVTIENVGGSCSVGAPLTFDGQGSVITGLSIKHVWCTSLTAGLPAIAFSDFAIDDATVEDVTWTSSNVATAGIIGVGQPGQNLFIRNLRMMTNPGTGNIGVLVGNGTMYQLAIEGIMQLNASPSNLIPLKFSGGGTFNLVTLKDMYLRAGGPAVQIATAITLPNLHLEDIYTNSIAALITIPTSQAAGAIRLTNVAFQGTNLITSLSPFNLFASNLNVNTTGAVIALTTVNATPVNLTLSNYTQAGAGADTSKDGAQVITLNKANYTTTTP